MFSEIKCWCNKFGFHVSSNTVLCYHHFMETDIKKSFLRWNFLPGFVPSQNLPNKTFVTKQERKRPVKWQSTVKLIPKRTQKASLPIISPLALPLHNYKKSMTKMFEQKPTTPLWNYWTMTIHFITLIIVKT